MDQERPAIDHGRREQRRLEINQIAAQDALLRPKAYTHDDVPWAAEAVTPEWLNDTIGHAFPGETIMGFKITGGSDGTTVRRRIVLELENGDGTKRKVPVFTKTLPSGDNRTGGAYTVEAEMNFYRILRPQLAIEAPRALYSNYDPHSYRTIHIFEDLVATRNATFNNYQTTINRQEAENIIDILAEFHGQFYGSQEIADMRWLKNLSAWFRNAHVASGFDREHRKAFEVGRDFMPKSLWDAGQESWDAFVSSLSMHESGPLTLLHSDVHLGNWYKTGAGAMGLCDWQALGKGHWGRDFAYAMGTNLAVEDRRSWEKDLITRYAERLSARSNVAITYDEVFDAYRRQLPAALAFWTTTLVPPPIMPDMQPVEMSRTMLIRITTAMADLDTLGAFRRSGFQSRNGPGVNHD